MRINFPQEIVEKLKYYVYLYFDPDTNEIIYVGKGKGDRVFQHLNDVSENEKVRKIEEIQKKWKQPKIEILVHGIEDELTAKKIESATIDLIGINKLTNINRGWESGIFGRMSIEEIISQYKKEEFDIGIEDKVILLRIKNEWYYDGILPQELYDITRGYWRIDTNRAEKATYVFCVHDGIVKEIYEIDKWLKAGSTITTRDLTKSDISRRSEFVGKKPNDDVRNTYLNKSVKKYFKKGTRNPIKYINC